MKKRTITAGILLSLTILTGSVMAQKQAPLYKNAKAPITQRVESLMKQMTLDEKIMQLTQGNAGQNDNQNNQGEKIKGVDPLIGSLIYTGTDVEYRNRIQKEALEDTRLGIPVLFGYDVIHGFRTVYPIPLAQACSWNPALATQSCNIAARESYLTGINWTFAPMIDVARDPRWGRVAEGYGEDPYTNAIFCRAAVKGFQGENISNPYSIASCLKHFVGYGLSEGGRDYHYSDVSPQSLWETYLPPYEAGVKAGAATVMSAFNDISGVPASANHYTLTEILKQRWGFKGFVVSDWFSIQQLIAQGAAKDEKEAGYKAFYSGVDMDMGDNIFPEHLKKLVEEKKVPMSRIDDAVSRILTLKFKLGLFEHPYAEMMPESQRYLKEEDKTTVKQMAEESMVLLKNAIQTLPVSNTVKNIAVIGPMAKDQGNLLGSWSGHGRAEDVLSFYNGIEHEFNGQATLQYAQGCDFEGNDQSGFNQATEVATNSDLIVLCLGERREWSGENASRSSIALPTVQQLLLESLKKTGKPIVVVLSNGRPLDLSKIEPLADAIIEAWQPGIQGGAALAGILSGRVNPSGRLAITFPYCTGQIPIYYNMRQSARPTQGLYQDVPTDPLYPFGYGLSYTTYHYGPVRFSSTKIKKNQKLIAEVEVTNTGSKIGKETVLWYISQPVCTITRPIKELKYFEKKEIQPGKTVTYRFEINPMRDLSYIDSNGHKFLEENEYFLLVNGQKLKFEITK
ncbi:MAG: glycoside hydrolase family 3 N-terminal domain-containing protein [Bacteroidota bacterium]|nr:glycoside hydrolase family 3 N-terminal domain-containing protein [Bacteroidota bacterium]